MDAATENCDCLSDLTDGINISIGSDELSRLSAVIRQRVYLAQTAGLVAVSSYLKRVRTND
jgi:hypothetical protein